MLLETSKVSKTWRDCALQSQLWRQKYTAEGWGYNVAEVANFEKTLLARGGLPKQGKSRKAEAHAEQRGQKRKARDIGSVQVGSITSQPQSMARSGPISEPRSHAQGSTDSGIVAGLSRQESLQDEEMRDVDTQSVVGGTERTTSFSDRMDTQDSSQSEGPSTPGGSYGQSIQDETIREPFPESGSPLREPSLVFPSFSGSPRLNFHHVYKHRKRLEENWSAGRYKSFQLPHASHPEEAHTECVYTIQYSGKYLVSGSRDRTLRIWNLDTQRLVQGPLTGHTGSVLCLQFDEKEDIIISGSSDTDVVIWQFSSGRMINKISQAHKESVLNLKFDKRFLVTCSKDKTIKIWNRQKLRPGDKDYPIRGVPGGGKCPEYIIDLSAFSSPYDIEEGLTLQQKEPISEYSTIMTIDSHGAAVNAVHIHDDQLVSASGDRSLKVWNIHSGVCTAVCRGHTKGIACVQYDGTRVVSGSSDNTIRIFDPVSQAEVGCLEGHSKLVRTIQASFGDTPGSQEDLELEARATDRSFFEARESGDLSDTPTGAHRNRDRNAGSRRPEDIMAIGAKLPPGGGGSQWARIVSGSYDESIIVWKKAYDGRWVVGHRLNQGDALRAAGPVIFAHSDRVHRMGGPRHIQQHHGHGPLVVPPAPIAYPNGQPIPHAPPGSQQPPPQMSTQQLQAHMSAQQIIQHALQSGAAALHNGLSNVPEVQNLFGANSAQQLGANPAILPQVQVYQQHHRALMQQASRQAQRIQMQIIHNAQFYATQGSYPLPQQQPTQPDQAQPQPQLQQAPAQQPLPQQNPVQQPPSQPVPVQQQPAQQQPAQQAPPQQPHFPQAAQPQPQAQPQVAPQPLPPAAPNPNHAIGQSNARVFKLQFDARRIICCSQDPKIVGWDFANDDEEIIECSRFFAPPT